MIKCFAVTSSGPTLFQESGSETRQRIGFSSLKSVYFSIRPNKIRNAPTEITISLTRDANERLIRITAANNEGVETSSVA